MTAPADFQISTTSGSGWTSSLTLPQAGGTVPSHAHLRPLQPGDRGHVQRQHRPLECRSDHPEPGRHRDSHAPHQRHQRHRAHGHDQQGPGRRPGGQLDAQRGGRQRPVQHLGGQPRQRLVRGQDPRRGRQRRLRGQRRPGGAGRHRVPHLRLLPRHQRRPLGHLRATHRATVDVAAGFNAISVTRPRARAVRPRAPASPVTWTTNLPVGRRPSSASGWSAPATAGTWARSHAADGTASYSDSVDLNVPGRHRLPASSSTTAPLAATPGASTGYASGTVERDRRRLRARSPSPRPRAARARRRAAGLPVGWTPNTARRQPASSASGWCSPGNGWYVGKIVGADRRRQLLRQRRPERARSTPATSIFVYYRATSRRPLGHLRLRLGHGQRDRAAFSSYHRHRAHGHHEPGPGQLPCRSAWTPNTAVASGQFSIWVVSPGNGWYVGKIVAADLKASYVDIGRPERAGRQRLPRVRLLPRHHAATPGASTASPRGRSNVTGDPEPSGERRGRQRGGRK